VVLDAPSFLPSGTETVSLVMKQPGHKTDLSLPSVMNVINAWNYISMPCVYLNLVQVKLYPCNRP
jgi:hypothetical protein